MNNRQETFTKSEVNKITEELNNKIEQLLKQNEELHKAKLYAEKSSQQKSDFLASMSHEIRTPMNTILGFSQILQKKLTDPKHSSFANNIENSGKYLLSLINDILDLSKIEAQHLKIDKEHTNIHDIINELPHIFYEMSKKAQTPISINIENVPESLLVDGLRFKQILLNLVSNALKFTSNGSVRINVSAINKNAKSIYLKIEVKDTGIGIPKNELSTIFENFKQADGQSSGEYGGTGLGLAITKNLVKLMNGTLSVKSTVGKGSTFKILFKDVELSNIEISQNIANNTNVISKKYEVLHIEDIDVNRILINLYLEEENIIVRDAVNGKEALKILDNYTPDLILMDIEMPELNGCETTKIIRKITKLKSIPIIAITANAGTKDIKKYNTIFDDTLIKPVTKDLLLKTISIYFEKGKNKVEIIKQTETVLND